MKRIRRAAALAAAVLFLFTGVAAEGADNTAQAAQAAQAAGSTLKKGSKGDEVVTLQKKLKQWGYYDGAVDGIFGSGTQKAVEYFQRKNGLTADGIVGAKTAAALGMTLSGGSAAQASSSSDRSVRLLAACIYGESRGEPYKGQVAVGAVILNRVKSSKVPTSIAGVIYQ